MSDSIKSIQERMKAVRRELGNDLATSARDITNWRSYVRSSPWIWLGGALALGYFIVPKKSPSVKLSEQDLDKILRETRTGLELKARTKSGFATRMSGSILSNLSSFALKAAVAYVGHRLASSQEREKEREEEGRVRPRDARI